MHEISLDLPFNIVDIKMALLHTFHHVYFMLGTNFMLQHDLDLDLDLDVEVPWEKDSE